MRYSLTFMLTVSWVVAAAAPDGQRYGTFTIAADADNSWLPTSIRWGTVELIDAQLGLNHSFVSFESRRKIYHDDNKHAWDRSSPRFNTDVAAAEMQEVESGESVGYEVVYQSSYADVRRRLLCHRGQPELRIEYDFTMSRRVVVHEAHDFVVALRFTPGFTDKAIPDIRSQPPALLRGTVQPMRAAITLSTPPLALVHHPASNVYALVTGEVSGVATPVPPTLVEIAAGATLRLSLRVQLFAGEEPTAPVLARAAALPDWQRPYQLVEIAKLLLARQQLDEAETALLEAGQLSASYAKPYALLAALRRDHQREGEAAAWAEAGVRHPYNYGYTLSGRNMARELGLPEPARRLHMLNQLIAVENCQFYPDYYVWAARDFEEMGMLVQACAMYRQALWALAQAPYPAAKIARIRAAQEQKLAELETRLLEQTAPVLPAETRLPLDEP